MNCASVQLSVTHLHHNHTKLTLMKPSHRQSGNKKCSYDSTANVKILTVCAPPPSRALRGERVVRVVGLRRAVQGNVPQAAQVRPAGAPQRRTPVSPRGGAGRLCRVLDAARPLPQLTG